MRIANTRNAQRAVLLWCVLVTALGGCSGPYSPFSGERGAVILLFPYLWWPLKLGLYYRFIYSYLPAHSRARSLVLAGLRVALGAGFFFTVLAVAGEQEGWPLSFPLVSLLAWAIIYAVARRSSPEIPAARFIGFGLGLSLLLNLLAIAVTGVIGIGC